MKPILAASEQYERSASEFKGWYNEPFGNVTRFREMRNMTGQDAPVLRTRDPRRFVRAIENCRGIFARGNRLGWVTGTSLYYNGTLMSTVLNSDKTFVNMGAYVCIFPDKLMLNTETGALTDMENSVTVSGTITYTPCDILGESADYSTATYVKVAATGIGSGFRAGDVVKFTGSSLAGIGGDSQLIMAEVDYLVIIGTMDSASATQSGGLSLERTVPDMDFVTECDNRLWGCSSANHEIYACKLGDPTNWRCYQGLSTDSYTVTVGSEGDFTGAVTHLGYVLFFKNDRILKVFGNKPGNYQMAESRVRGVTPGSEKSLCIMNETLYYLSETGMCAYEGALPEGISQAWGNLKYKNAVSGSAFGRMWVSPANGPLLVYDDDRHLWHVEDEIRVKWFAKTEKALYAADNQGNLWRIAGEDNGEYDAEDAYTEEKLPFMIETGDMELAVLDHIRVQKILVRLNLTNGSTARVLVKYDDNEPRCAAQWTGAMGKYIREIAIVPRRCDHFRIRIEGTGRMELMNLSYLFKPSGTVWVK